MFCRSQIATVLPAPSIATAGLIASLPGLERSVASSQLAGAAEAGAASPAQSAQAASSALSAVSADRVCPSKVDIRRLPALLAAFCRLVPVAVLSVPYVNHRTVIWTVPCFGAGAKPAWPVAPSRRPLG